MKPQYTKDVTEKQFDRTILKPGLPIQIVFYKGYANEQTDVGLITEVSRGTLKYVTVAPNGTRNYSVSIENVGIGLEISVGNFV